MEDFTAAARRYLWISLRWVVLNVIAGVIFYVNFVFYGGADSTVLFVIRSFIGGLAFLWIAVQFYVWPFLIEQEDKRLLVALRNALFLTLANPLFTLTLLLAGVLIIAVSMVTVLPVGVFTTVFLAMLANRAVVERLREYGKLPS